jgi:glutathione S-transferase
MQLYEFGATRSLRARWMLQELGVEFEPISVNLLAGEHRKPEFLKINPAGKLPVLVDRDVVVTESVAILLYLAEKYPLKGFLPRESVPRAQVFRWLLFAATELEQPLWRIVRHTRVYPEADRVPADVPIAAREFQEMAAVLDQHMQGRRYLVDDHITVADILTAYTLDWGHDAKLLGDFPRLVAYMEQMYARPNATPRIAGARPKTG